MESDKRGLVERFSRRMAIGGMGAIGLGAALRWGARPASAQDSTPADEGCPGDPHVEDSVVVVGPDGAPVLNVTATEMSDPFEDYDPRGAPARGQRFALIQLEIEAVGPRPFNLDAYAFTLQDSDGFAARPIGVTLPADTTLVPLASATLEEGAVAKGFLAFSILQGVRLDRLFFHPAGDRLILIADLRE